MRNERVLRYAVTLLHPGYDCQQAFGEQARFSIAKLTFQGNPGMIGGLSKTVHRFGTNKEVALQNLFETAQPLSPVSAERWPPGHCY